MHINVKSPYKDLVRDRIWLESYRHNKKYIQPSPLEANLMLYLFCFFLLVNERQTFLKVTGLVRAEVHYPPPKFPVCDKVHKE